MMITWQGGGGGAQQANTLLMASKNQVGKAAPTRKESV